MDHYLPYASYIMHLIAFCGQIRSACAIQLTVFISSVSFLISEDLPSYFIFLSESVNSHETPDIAFPSATLSKVFGSVTVAVSKALFYWSKGVNPFALRKAKIAYNFGLSECSRFK